MTGLPEMLLRRACTDINAPVKLPFFKLHSRGAYRILLIDLKVFLEGHEAWLKISGRE